MKVGDLVSSSDPFEKLLGVVVAIEPDRIGEDLNIRETKVFWPGRIDLPWTQRGFTWAMRNGLTVIN